MFLDDSVGNQKAIALLIGFLSSAVDNVPLVAGGIRMYLTFRTSLIQFLGIKSPRFAKAN